MLVGHAHMPANSVPQEMRALPDLDSLSIYFLSLPAVRVTWPGRVFLKKPTWTEPRGNHRPRPLETAGCMLAGQK